MKKRLKKKLHKKGLMKLVDELTVGKGIVNIPYFGGLNQIILFDYADVGITFNSQDFLDLSISARWKRLSVVDPKTNKEVGRYEK